MWDAVWRWTRTWNLQDWRNRWNVPSSAWELGPPYARVNHTSQDRLFQSQEHHHTITCESFTLPSLNNWPPHSKMGTQAPQTSWGWCIICRAMLDLSMQGEWSLDSCQSWQGHQLEWRGAAAPRKIVSEKQKQLLNPRFPRQKQGREIWESDLPLCRSGSQEEGAHC